MMGLEPTTFCMARASCGCAGSGAFFKRLTRRLWVRISERTRTRANAEPCHPCLCGKRRPAGLDVLESRGSGRDVLIRPSTGADAFVQRVGSEVSPAGPDDGTRLGIELDPHEPLHSPGFVEHRPSHPLEHGHLTCDA